MIFDQKLSFKTFVFKYFVLWESIFIGTWLLFIFSRGSCEETAFKIALEVEKEKEKITKKKSVAFFQENDLVFPRQLQHLEKGRARARATC